MLILNIIIIVSESWICSQCNLYLLPFSLFSRNSLYRKDMCQSPDPPASSFAQSFAAAVAAGGDRNAGNDIHSESDNNLCITSVWFALRCSLFCFLRPGGSLFAWGDVGRSVHPPHQPVQIQRLRSAAVRPSAGHHRLLQRVSERTSGY